MVGPLEILVIDDKEPIRTLLKYILGGEGEHVDTAGDGQKGIEMYVARYNAARTNNAIKPYNIVFTDLGMLGASGADVVRAVKGLSPNTPVYVITGFEANEEYARLAEELGQLKPDGIIQKPFDIMEIIELTKKVRQNYQS